MKRIIVTLFALILAISASAQFKALMQKKANVIAPMQKNPNIDLPVVGELPANIYVSNKTMLTDPVSSVTRYDLQSNASNLRRIRLFPDGTIGTTATWSQQDASWTDRGTGYNYYDGSSFGPLPTSRIEDRRTGWPSYCFFGPNGEMTIAHQSSGPLVMCSRPVKGSGTWTTKLLPALPATIPVILWPRAVTNGPDHTCIHIIALTAPTANGGLIYNGMNGAIIYSRSLDGGTTFSDWIQLPGMTSSEYTSFTADIYSFAEPKGDTLAFTVGDCFQDQFLMKSTDNGTTWTKTIIYNSPYNHGGNSPNFFYCPDGTMSVALDNQGIAHVVFGLQQDSGSPTASYYRPYTQGIIYWNETMPELRQDLNPDSLFLSGSYVAWVKDTNVFHLPSGVSLGEYYFSLTSNPELVIDKNNRMFLIWSGETTLVDANNYTLRHIFSRDAWITPAENLCWHTDTLVDLTADWIQYHVADCMYPSASPTSDDSVYILFQKDKYGGNYVMGIGTQNSQTSPDDNFITLIKWGKPSWSLPIGMNESHVKPVFSVGQNIPNPVTGLTKVNVFMQNGGDLSLTVTSLTGQTMISIRKNNVLPGVSQFNIDGSTLPPGGYFYTVTQGGERVTKKMIVQ
ncbi:MAG: T9SS type A sorting domain-containing protein [Bacteroidetes bacterium]|nr:T9SS type A sorting domain-containing protein [Bacteroidota bacterium]